MPRYIVQTTYVVGGLEKSLSDNGINAKCHCLISDAHDLHKYRKALNDFETKEKAIDLLQSLPQCSANLLCTHVVETRTGIRKLSGLPFVQSVQIDEYCSIAEFEQHDIITLKNDKPEPLAYLQYAIELVQYDKTWEYTQGAGVKVAVLDTGIFPHVDIEANLIEGKNFTSEQNTSDLNGHGTHVAGSIACAINNRGIYGAAPSVKIAPIKVMGKGGGGFSSDISQGIIWAADNGFDVINLSLGPYSLTFSKDAFDYAYSKGTIVVMASGNAGSELPSNWGAAYEKNISVGNTNQADLRHSSSMYGSLVDVAAPGTKIISCGLNSNTYTTKTGTSMACPHVAALVALMIAISRQYNTTLTLEKIRELLQDFGEEIQTDKPVGNRINALATIEGLVEYLQVPLPEDNELVELTFSNVILTTKSYENTIQLNNNNQIITIPVKSEDVFDWHNLIKDESIKVTFNLTSNEIIALLNDSDSELDLLLNKVETSSNNPRLRQRLKELFGRGKFMALLADAFQEELNNNPNMRDKRRKRLERTIRILRRGASWLGSDGVAELSDDELTQLELYKNILL